MSGFAACRTMIRLAGLLAVAALLCLGAASAALAANEPYAVRLKISWASPVAPAPEVPAAPADQPAAIPAAPQAAEAASAATQPIVPQPVAATEKPLEIVSGARPLQIVSANTEAAAGVAVAALSGPAARPTTATDAQPTSFGSARPTAKDVLRAWQSAPVKTGEGPFWRERSRKPMRVEQQRTPTALVVTVKGGTERLRFKTYKMERMRVVDISGAWRLNGEAVRKLNQGPIKAMRIGVHKDKLRLVFDYTGKESVLPEIVSSPKGLTVSYRLG